MFTSFLQLVYPKLCGACEIPLLLSEDFICTKCKIDLPRLHMFTKGSNWLTAKFDGLFPFTHANSFFIFAEGGRVQHLMHQIKYKGAEDLGEYIGFWCGTQMKKSYESVSYDLMIPIPLFPQKQKERGYNQAICLAKGISRATNLPYSEKILQRIYQTHSLVGQNRVQRHESLKDVFEVKNAGLIIGKHILIVDDTLTTGATFIAAAEKLKAAGASEISFLALAALK